MDNQEQIQQAELATSDGESHGQPVDTADGGPQEMLPNGLTRAQQEGVDRARAFAMELQQTVFKDLMETERSKKEEESRPPAGTVNPGLMAGMDARNHSLMSRVYVGSINFELTEEHINRVFSEFGSVRSVSMSKDATTGRHKGFGFVEYDVPEAASLVMEVMNGTMLGGRQLRIGRPNNYNVAVTQDFPEPPAERIYLANVNEAIGEDVLREIFAPFGEVKACVLAPDMVLRKHRGWGFVEFAEADAADQAAMAMNGFQLGNLVLRVRKCVVGGPLGEGMAALDAEPRALPQPVVQPPQQVMDVVASINRSIGIPEAPESTGAAAASGGGAGAAEGVAAGSTVVVLENVVGGREEVDDELASDMAGEGAKCGRIARVVVHIASAGEMAANADQLAGEVSIFVHYADPRSAAGALELFGGRWFGGRRVSARLFDTDRYRVVTSADTMVYIP
ncbi:hypothetical protein LPJ61_000238 [Coemansia biformis]|uniref:RRM domain-containing protein n=1 Tax=Coemansia biformis TaxID=1286918 RepID=A0A9W8CZ73_9FUNG|nr:hypothetical protein LPJ61_000238 [Coemansia biformis]